MKHPALISSQPSTPHSKSDPKNHVSFIFRVTLVFIIYSFLSTLESIFAIKDLHHRQPSMFVVLKTQKSHESKLDREK